MAEPNPLGTTLNEEDSDALKTLFLSPSQSSESLTNPTETLDKSLPSGGIILSTYVPQKATKWLEEHKNDDLLRNHGFDGPLAFQITPYETVLAIFGTNGDDISLQFSKSQTFWDSLYYYDPKARVRSPLFKVFVFAIASAEALRNHRKYREPQVLITKTAQKSKATTWGLSLKVPAPVALTPSVAHTRGTTDTEARAEQTPAPPTKVQYSPGAEWGQGKSHEKGMDFDPYDIVWRPAKDQDGVPQETQFKFNVTLEVHPNPVHASGLPNDIGCVLRNQIMLWVHPEDATEAQGIILVASSYIPNVFTDRQLNIHEGIELDLRPQSLRTATHYPNDAPAAGSSKPGPHDTTTYVGVGKIPLAEPASLLTKTLRKFKLKQPAQVYNQGFHNVVMPRNREAKVWKDVIWPAIDEELSKMDRKRAAVCEWTRQDILVVEPLTNIATPATSNSAHTGRLLFDANTTETDTQLTTPMDSTPDDGARSAK
ncbi:hypothetical protein B0H19DRAFT_1251415 [Mycena capillaripes]|nr:hypothetical protein B0H19DRAFT_1251415 [Mycena capillaripes]